MSYISTKKKIDRRTMLKGTGVSMALPFLGAMLPAFQTKAASKKSQAPKRFIAAQAPLGFHMPYFTPEKAGKDYDLPEYLKLIKDHRNDFTIFSGFCHPNQNGANGHSSGLTWLTSVERPGLAGFKNRISIDQVMAAKIGAATRYQFMNLSASGGHSLSWTANGVSIPYDPSPVKVFKKLFVDQSKDQIKKDEKNLLKNKSILDTVMQPAKDLEKTLGNEDRQKLEEYLSSVRALEIRLEQNKDWVNKPKPKVDFTVKNDPDKHGVIEKQRLFYELMALALQTDSTRVMTYSLGSLSAPIANLDGVKNDWHNLSHHGKDPAKIAELKIVEDAEFVEFNRFLNRVKSMKEGNGNVLDNTAILFGSNLGSAASHNWHNLPIMIAGGGFKHGSHIVHDSKNNTNLANLFVPLLNHMGVEVDRFGTSTSSSVEGFSI
ncbi:MAG: DUF1552 domain-containing protein [Lentisphaeraceae bacterium]|nr:DUF1552 domain-containing protein [Lentisphaeraceae bacterium]